MNTASITRKQTSFHLNEDPLKRYKHKTEAIDKLEEILKLLVNEFLFPEKSRLHVLSGNYRGYMECRHTVEMVE